MVLRSQQFGYVLRPHFKTHQSLDIADIYRNYGVEHITVSSIKMARYFSDRHWKSIHIAFPPTQRSRGSLIQLIEQVPVSLNISCAAHIDAIKGIDGITALIDIDSGYGRTGVPIEDETAIDLLISELEFSNIPFGGFYCHNGSTYHQPSLSHITALHDKVTAQLGRLKEIFSKWNPRIIYGDTPGCASASSFDGIDEVSAGNSVFFDIYQYHLGVCSQNQIAVCMVCPVVEKKPSKNQVIIHGGAVHFSKDLVHMNGNVSFGSLVKLNNDGWSTIETEASLISVSQEHGTLQLSEKTFNSLSEGDLVGILPVHSCLTADCMGEYISFDKHVWTMMKKQLHII